MKTIHDLAEHLKGIGIRPARCFDLPLPPSVNHCYRQWRGRTLLSRKYRQWIQAADFSFMVSQLGRHEPLTGRVLVALIVRPGKGWTRSRDMDNLLKPVQDWLVRSGLIQGDNCGQVPGCASLFLDGPPEAEARLTVCLVPLEENPASTRKPRLPGVKSRKKP
jgi:Holliday junction resolvase RusA-like endonuclease